MSYAARFRQCLARPGKTRRGVAHAMGVSQQAIYAIVSGKTKSATASGNALAALYFGCSPDWLATGAGDPRFDEPDRTAVAHNLSQLRETMPLERLDWGALMGDLPATFELELLDDAMGPDFPLGSIVRLSTKAQPKAGWPVLVVDKDGNAYLRDYVQGRGGFTATARARGYKALDSDADGLRVLAVLSGVIFFD